MDTEKPSVRNRISLWAFALSWTERNLVLVQRASSWSSSESVAKDLKQHGGTFQTYPSEDPHHGVRHRVFPIFSECDDIIAASMTSAIIYYSQLLTTGNADGDRIHSNSKSLCGEMWAYSLDLLENNGIKQQSVETLNKEVISARNGMIAHADGREFHATTNESGYMVSCRSYEQSWQTIDINLWFKVTCLLRTKFGLLASGLHTAG